MTDLVDALAQFFRINNWQTQDGKGAAVMAEQVLDTLRTANAEATRQHVESSRRQAAARTKSPGRTLRERDFVPQDALTPDPGTRTAPHGDPLHA